jgi:hypothetical protein
METVLVSSIETAIIHQVLEHLQEFAINLEIFCFANF